MNLQVLRRAVKREGAERYLLLTLVSFAGSVILTRVYLDLADYPQIGNSELHIAHVLWGGLLLFIAALLPIMFANRWVYTLDAILGGIGVGLFIDEVGKFITQTNDYFHPAAAPIIYAFFLLTVLLYLQLRRPASHDSRAELYRALDQLMEVIENDLDRNERAALDARLQRIIDNPAAPEHRHLAEAMLDVLHSDALEVHEPVPRRIQLALDALQRFEEKYLTRARMRTLIVVGLFLTGIGALGQLAVSAFAVFQPDVMETLIAELLINERYVQTVTSASWYLVLLTLDGAVGFFLVFGSALLLTGREQLGSRAGYIGLLLSLTTVNLLVFYFNQFAAISTTIIQFALLLLIVRYRTRYLGTGIGITTPEAESVVE